MERFDQLSSGLVVAGVDRVEHPFNKFRAQLVLFVDRIGIERRISWGRGGDMLALAQLALPALTRLRPPMGRAALAQPARGP